MADLITGDAVTLELRVAGLPSRILSLAMDLAVLLVLLVATSALVAWVFSAGGSPGAQAAVTLTTLVMVVVGWPTLIETLTRGRSLGKVMMGLRVVRDDGGPVRVRHSLVRALAMVFLDLWTTSGVVGGISALVSARSKRVGDHLAGTIVVGERLPRSATVGQQAIVMPPPLAPWAATLDLVAVPDGLALNARTFLTRAPSLDPAARVAIAQRLATQVAWYVRTPAPPGTPAEAYLAAVLAERTRRSWVAAPALVAPQWGAPHRLAPATWPGQPPAAPTPARPPAAAPAAPGAPPTPAAPATATTAPARGDAPGGNPGGFAPPR